MTKEELDIIRSIETKISETNTNVMLAMQSITHLEAHVRHQNGKVKENQEKLNTIIPKVKKNEKDINMIIEETDHVRFWYRNPTLLKTYNIGKVILLIVALSTMALALYNFMEKVNTVEKVKTEQVK